MSKNEVFETSYERFLRERSEKIVQQYSAHSHEILAGELSPNRIIQHLAHEFKMSGEGVKQILKRKGIYVSARQPFIRPKVEPIQLSMFSVEKTPVARAY